MKSTGEKVRLLPKGAEIVGDVRKAPGEKDFAEGPNVLLTSGDGRTITALVRNGNPVDYIVSDKAGNVLPSTRHSSEPVTNKAVKCYICYTSDSGTTKCVQITCPGQHTS